MLTENQFYERLALEAKLLKSEAHGFEPVKGDLTHWYGFIIGTGTYEGGVFCLEIVVDREFPFNPPKIIWHTRIWHPNFSDEQKPMICLSLLTKDWTPSSSLLSFIEAIRDLLEHPNPKDPLNIPAAQEMLTDYETYAKNVRDYLKRYAGWTQRALRR